MWTRPSSAPDATVSSTRAKKPVFRRRRITRAAGSSVRSITKRERQASRAQRTSVKKRPGENPGRFLWARGRALLDRQHLEEPIYVAAAIVIDNASDRMAVQNGRP